MYSFESYQELYTMIRIYVFYINKGIFVCKSDTMIDIYMMCYKVGTHIYHIEHNRFAKQNYDEHVAFLCLEVEVQCVSAKIVAKNILSFFKKE